MADQIINVSSAAVSTLTIPKNKPRALIQVQGAPIRWRMGTDPTTASGNLAAAGEVIKISGADMADFRAIAVAENAVLLVTYGNVDVLDGSPSGSTQLTLKGEATLSLTTSAQGLSAATLVAGGTGIPAGSSYAHVTLEGGKIRYLLTGNPTSTLGKLLTSAVGAEVEFELENAAEVNGFKAVAISGAPILTITYKG